MKKHNFGLPNYMTLTVEYAANKTHWFNVFYKCSIIYIINCLNNLFLFVGYLMRVPSNEVRNQICSSLTSFFTRPPPKQQLQSKYK